MSAVREQVRRAHRRLTCSTFLSHLSVGVLIAASAWAVAIIAARLFALALTLTHGAWLGLLAAGLIAVIGTARGRPTALQAAIALDRAAGLKERLSTALALRAERDDFARAAVADAEKCAAGVHVPSHIRYQPPRLWPWSAATALAALILLRFMPVVDVLAGSRTRQQPVDRALVEAEHRAINVEFQNQLTRLKSLSEDNPNLTGLAEELQPLELPETPGVTPEDLRREAVKRLDNVNEKLKRELEATERNPVNELPRLLERLQRPDGDATDSQLSQALAAGDFEGARQALQKTSEEIRDAAKHALDPEAQRKLSELQAQLTRLAERVNKLSDSTPMQKELQNRANLSEEEARKLLEELPKTDAKELAKELQKRLGTKGLSARQLAQLATKIAQNQQTLNAAKKLAQSLTKAAQACKHCQSGTPGDSSAAAAAALAEAAAQLSEAEAVSKLARELQAQIATLDDLRDGVCRGACQSPHPSGPGLNAGLGLGARIGQDETPSKVIPSRARTRIQGGAITGQMLIDGPRVRGQAAAEVTNAAAAEVRDALDAIEREEVPRQYHRVLQVYFERLAGLVRDKQESADPPQPAQP